MHFISEDSISKSFLQEVLSVLAFLNPCISDIVIYSALTDQVDWVWNSEFTVIFPQNFEDIILQNAML